jgi:peptidoglycan/xylan/chitin deacetylase (PgdA/CDA1 family)
MSVQFINYHRTALKPEMGDVYTLPSKTFLRQLDLIQSSGVQIIRSADAFVESKEHRLAISFDDGYKSDISNAELLLQRRMSAFFFVSTAMIDKTGYLSTDDIRNLDKIGMVVGSHSHDHIDLTSVPLSEAKRQLSLSMQCLADVLGRAVECVAFPGGAYNGPVVAAAIDTGFKYCLTTEWGINSFAKKYNNLAIKRNNILSGMSEDEFLKTITLRNRYKRSAIYAAKQISRSVFPENIYNQLRGWIQR